MSAKIKGEKVFLDVSSSCLGRAMVALFLSFSGRLRRPSLGPDVLYVIRKYAKIPWWYCNNSRKCITIYRY